MAGVLQGEVLLPEQIADLLGLEGALGAAVGALIGAFVVGNVMLAFTGVAGPWAKRKITAAFTDRIAVDRIGPFGLFIIVADSVRLLSKELIIPDGADRPSYDLAPLILPASAMLGFAVIPMGSLGPLNIQLADPEAGLALVFRVCVDRIGVAGDGRLRFEQQVLADGRAPSGRPKHRL